MTKYSNGVNYERKFKQLLLNKGATLVVRSAGSKGLIDLVAFFYDRVELYQIKTTADKHAYFKPEIEILKSLVIPENTKKFLAIYYKQNKKRSFDGWVIMEVKNG